MPWQDPDPTDPMTLHGVELDTDDGAAAEDMARCFIEEYARLGYGAARIREMFGRPEYAGMARAMEQVGPSRVEALIDEYFATRRGRGDRLDLDQRPDGAVCLPVLNP